MSLQCVRETGVWDEWGDSAAACHYDGKLHTIGQARNAIIADNFHYVYDIATGERLYKISGPFSGRGEACLSLIGNKITIVGGTTTQDVWDFDPSRSGYAAGSWSQVNADYTGTLGNRKMAFCFDWNGWFYIGGGQTGDDIYKTQDFITWTYVCDLPNPIKKLSACGCAVFNDKVYLIGGADNLSEESTAALYAADHSGYVYEFDPSDDSFTLLTTDTAKFGTIWIDAIATDSYIYVSAGLDVATQRNVRGFWRSTDGVTWESVSTTDGLAFYGERHRTGVALCAGVPYLIGGYGWNDMWKIVE